MQRQRITPDDFEEIDELPPSFVPLRYQQESIKGCRLPGWEDLNTIILANELGVSVQHLRQVLTGRSGCSMTTAKEIARHLGLTLDELVKKITQSQLLDRERKHQK